MCNENIPNLVHLTQSSAAAVSSSVSPDILQHPWANVDYQLDVCKAANGARIKTYEYFGTKQLYFIIFKTRSKNIFYQQWLFR